MMSVAKALDVLKTAMAEDPSYAWGWHCNLAVPIMDGAGISREKANRAAAYIMQHIFEIDTSKHEHFIYEE